MRAFGGIDWASDHHDVALVNRDGALLAKARISDDLAGLQQLLDLLTEHGDSEKTPIPVAIETSRGLLVACLRATKRPVYAINPMAAARYRERHAVTRKKSDQLDAMVLANILRTDTAAHRPLPEDSELVQSIAVLARAQQDAVWDRTQAGNKLRSHLREYFPAFLTATQPLRDGLCSPIARTILAAAPTPARAASPGAKTHYDRRRNDGDRHTAAQRNLFNRMIGCLHHCLTKRIRYDEATAFPASADQQLPAAA
ncbi:IS110 family transposase [Streptomyces phaeochromogenes]|uniref:IS110 family transposase n=1 Tax=Streptomyces phaeochromogenes TaxID=1923 RepID=UPI00386D35DE